MILCDLLDGRVAVHTVAWSPGSRSLMRRRVDDVLAVAIVQIESTSDERKLRGASDVLSRVQSWGSQRPETRDHEASCTTSNLPGEL